jgi:hypothetical protein
MTPSWYPSEHTYTGDTDGQMVLPHYLYMPDHIQVYDAAVLVAGWTYRQRKLWRKARNAALARWGYPWVAKELKDATYETYKPQGITLRPYIPDPGYGANSYGGFGLAPIERPATSEYDEHAWSAGKGFALIHPNELKQAFDGRVTGRLTGVICHEIGHALGFGHGGTGIMWSTVDPPYYPNAEELAALEAYWGRA